jgi:hypothetical protein
MTGGAAPEAHAGPFTPGDPLTYSELSPEARGWRAVIHLLAVTGRTLTLPRDMFPGAATLAVCGGWRYHCTMTATAGEQEWHLTARFTGWPEPRPGESPT